MIYSVKGGKAKAIKPKQFKLEKEIQNLIENNIEEIFNLKLLKSELPFQEFRFDTVAYDTENNTFIILEYKRNKNNSLVDQGYAYLNTLLDRKSEIVLLYNKVFKASKQTEDFAWENIRIYFVSAGFSDFQKVATGFADMPFRLFEVKQYESDLITVAEINDKKRISSPKSIMPNEKSDRVAREVKVYTEEEHLSGISDSLKELYYTLKEKILELPDVLMVPTKMYIAFKLFNRNITDIKVYKSYIQVFINLPAGKLDDPYKKTRDISHVGTHGNGDYSFDLRNNNDLDYLIPLIKQSYLHNQ